jgi:hypothetical protein
MARLNDLAQGKMEAPKIRPEIIKIKPGHNYRDMKTPEVRTHIDWLKKSILESGVHNPIDVSYINGEVYLEAGECRLTACQELRKDGWDGWIPCFAVRGDEATVLAKSMVDNGGLPPSKMEFGRAADRLLAYGWTVEQVSLYIPAHVGVKGAKAKRYVSEAVDLHHAPIDVKKALREGVDGVQVSEGLALAASKSPLHAKETIEAAVKEAKSKGKTVAKRPKGAGKVTKQKHDFQAFTDKLLEAADILAQMILDDDVPIGELQKKARQYQRLRKG